VAWRPGQAKRRLDVLDHLVQEASERGAGRIRLRTQLLRAQALLELGDPRALAEADAYCAGVDRLGDPLSRWQSLSRRAATAPLAGRLDEAAHLASRAERLAEDLSDADAVWIGDIQRWELARFTGERATYRRRRPGSAPPVESWPPWSALILAEQGDLEGAATILAGFSARQAWRPGVNAGYDLWFPAIAAEAAARCGSDQLRGDLYQLLAPYRGTQVGCGAWVAYCGAVDYYLGLLAAAQADHTAAAAHLDAATAQHLRLGAPRWAALSRQQQDRQQHYSNGRNRFRRDGNFWAVACGGAQAYVPHAKGLHDIAVLLAHPGQPIPAGDLAGIITRSRGESALDRQALAAYRARLRDLDDDIAEADSNRDLERAARARAERDALVAELTRSVGRGGATPAAGRRNRKGPENRNHPHPARPAPPRQPPPGPGLPLAGSCSHRDDLQLSTRPTPHLGTMRPARQPAAQRNRKAPTSTSTSRQRSGREILSGRPPHNRVSRLCRCTEEIICASRAQQSSSMRQVNNR